MTEPDEDWFDADIAAMKLGYGEKAGLQIYRNYTRSFGQIRVGFPRELCRDSSFGLGGGQDE